MRLRDRGSSRGVRNWGWRAESGRYVEVRHLHPVVQVFHVPLLCLGLFPVSSRELLWVLERAVIGLLW